MRAYSRDVVELEVGNHSVLFDRRLLNRAATDAKYMILGVAHYRNNDGVWYSLSIDKISETDEGGSYNVVFSDGESVWRELCSEEDLDLTIQATEAGQ